MVLSEEDIAELLADLEREQRETEATRADLERAQRERDAAEGEKEAKKRKYEAELEWFQYEAELEWLQSENVEMLMFSLLEGPQQAAPTAVPLAVAAPAAEAITDTCVFPDTAAPDASVARAARKLGSVAGSCSEICRERGASNHPFAPGTVFPLEVRYHNSSWLKHGSSSSSNNNSNQKRSNNNSNSSSSSNDNTTSNYGPWWDTTCVVTLLRPFDPGKGCQRDARRGTAVLGVDLPFDAGKHCGGCSMEVTGFVLRVSSCFFLACVEDNCVSGCWASFLMGIFTFKICESRGLVST